MNNIFRFKQLFQLIKANSLETIREPGVLFWGIAFPILMSLGLGVAFTNKQDVVRKVAFIDKLSINNNLPDSIFKIETFIKKNAIAEKSDNEGVLNYKIVLKNDKLGNTTFLFRRTNWATAMKLLKQGKINLILDENNNQVEYHFDPLNPDAQLTYIKLSKIINEKNIVVKETETSIKPMTLSGTRYVDFLVPGLMAMGIMMSCLWGISYGIIEKRTKKLLRRMVATPMRKSNFLISIITVRVAMTFIESALLFLFTHFAFGISIQGSVPALFVIFIAGNIAFAGISVFISSNTSKTEIGNGLINAVVMPMMILSGIFFSYHNFPDWAIPIIQKFPLTMVADDMRSIFVEGAGFSQISMHAGILTLIGVVFFSAGIKLFKWH